MALTKDGEVYGWGKNDFGKLGHQYQIFRERERDVSKINDYQGQMDQSNILKPTKLQKLKYFPVRSVCCGTNHSIIVCNDNKVFTWGFGGNGRLGIVFKSH